jgi:hypothetical protein
MPIPQELKLVLDAGCSETGFWRKYFVTLWIYDRCDEFSATTSHLNLLRHPTPAVLRNARKIRLATATNQTDKRLNPQILLHIGR